MRFLFNLSALSLFCYHLGAQVSFSKLPQNLQMFPRDEMNMGHFEVEGLATENGWIKSQVSEHHGKIAESDSIHVQAGASFHFQHSISAGLKEYDLKVIFKNSIADTVAKVTNLVAGDFFIVDGQSNAECPLNEDTKKYDSTYFSPFNRVIGGNFSWLAALSADSIHPRYDISEDCRFKRPSADFFYHQDFGYAGAWGVRLQYELVNATGIPNCIVNGSAGGTTIFQHFASHTPSKPDSLQYSPGPHGVPPARIYDRIYKKLSTFNVVSSVKGIFFYQGESDGNLSLDSSMNYSRRFDILYKSWKADYPGLKKIFVMQINLGCGGEYHNLIREAQRKFSEDYLDVVVMSSVGSPLSDRAGDLCHYTLNGYSHIGAKLAPLAKKYINDLPLQDRTILPANIRSAYYTSIDTICLEFDKPVKVQDSCVYTVGVLHLKDYFFEGLDSTLALRSVHAQDNKIYLVTEEKKDPIKSITYLPKIFARIPTLYSGPWIVNAENPDLGAYAFSDFPVQPFRPPANFVVFPTPANDEVVLAFDTETQSIEIYDLYGKLIRSIKTTCTICTVDVEQLSAGVYIAVIKLSDRSIKTKLLVQKH